MGCYPALALDFRLQLYLSDLDFAVSRCHGRTDSRRDNPAAHPVVRDQRVLLDADLARFYGVTTFNLNKAVTRNLDRFPADFASRLTME